MDPAWGVIGSAVVTGVFGWLIMREQNKTKKAVSSVHAEVVTNHGIRAGARIEKLTDDVLWLRENVATSAELDRHTQDDRKFQERVEPFLQAREA